MLTTRATPLPTTGIPYVVVNGTVVVKDSEVLRASSLASRSGTDRWRPTLEERARE
jgi:hypothetical protein